MIERRRRSYNGLCRPGLPQGLYVGKHAKRSGVATVRWVPMQLHLPNMQMCKRIRGT